MTMAFADTSPARTDMPIASVLRASSRQPLPTARSRILVVDDALVNLQVISAYLAKEGYTQVETVQDSRDALKTILRFDPDLLLLDLMMPHVSGIDILRSIRETPLLQHLAVIVVTAAEERDLKKSTFELGVADFLAKPLDAEDLILRVRNALELKSYRDSLEEMVLARTAELTKSREDVIYCLARAAEYRDNDTANHVIRVGRYVGLIAGSMGIDAEMRRMLELASALHDMGKIGIPDAILLKPGPLTDDERNQMKEHCRFGAEICTPDHLAAQDPRSPHVVVGAMMMSASHSPLLQMASRIALSHHERWDGQGYPHGLRGDEIPIEGRITAVADVFDALCSKRPYKSAMNVEKCVEIVASESGKHFDPQVVEAFLRRKPDVLEIYHAHQDQLTTSAG